MSGFKSFIRFLNLKVLQLEKELESMALQMENKLDAILGEKFKLEQEIERLQESLERTNEDFKKARMEKNKALHWRKSVTWQICILKCLYNTDTPSKLNGQNFI